MRVVSDINQNGLALPSFAQTFQAKDTSAAATVTSEDDDIFGMDFDNAVILLLIICGTILLLFALCILWACRFTCGSTRSHPDRDLAKAIESVEVEETELPETPYGHTIGETVNHNHAWEDEGGSFIVDDCILDGE